MSTYDFMVAAKKAVCNWIANRYAVESRTVAIDWTDVFNKAILAAPTPDQYLFEATYNGDKEQMYLDVYDKIGNVCINGVNMEV